MHDSLARRFVPLDLAPYANGGPRQDSDQTWHWTPDGPPVRRWRADWPVDITGFPHGDQFFHGIPFHLSDPATTPDRGWLLLSNQPNLGLHQTTIYLDEPQTAAGLVVAHFTDLELPQVRVGELLATYTLLLEDGQRVANPVRRRFEIAGRQSTLGTQAYTALPHLSYRPLRTPGVDSAGLYGIAMPGSKQTYWLTAIENPAPHKRLIAIELVAHHADIVAIGGITLACHNANPLRRGPRTGILIDLAAPPHAAADITPPQDDAPDLEFVTLTPETALAVDLGSIIRFSPASTDPLHQWAASAIQGWGEAEPVTPASLIYAEVVAAQDAHLLLRRGDSLYRYNWQDILDGNSPIKLAAQTWVRVSVRIVDAADGQELAARVHFRGPHGEYLPPLSHTADVNDAWGQNVGGDLRLGSMSYAYTPGRFEIMLPVGPVGVEVIHGFEYKPLRDMLDIQPDQTEIVLPLTRWSDIRRRGYYCGDVHVHFLDPVTATLEADAEDLNVVNLMAVQWGRSYTNVEHGIGREFALDAPNRTIRLDSENRHHIMGHVFLLNLKEPIQPLSSGGPTEDEIGGWEEASLVDWCSACKAQGGQVFTQFTPTPHAEVVTAIALGLIDAVEVRWFDFSPHLQFDGHWGETPFAFPGVQQWYAYLNAGYRLPAVGGTDKMSNAMPVGALRTYTFLGAGAPFHYTAWCSAIAQGQTFVSTGPLLELSVDGEMPGSEIHLPTMGGPVQITAVARSAQPFDAIDIIQNGRIIAHARTDASKLNATLETSAVIDASSWIAARCYGRAKLQTRYPTDIAAHTSPVYVTVGHQRQTSTPDADYLLTLLEGGAAYLANLAVWRNQAQRQHHLDRLEQGRQAILHHHPEARPHWQ